MILDIFDKNFIRIDEVAEYTYASYTNPLNGSGSFELQMALNDVAKNIVKNGEYILFELDVLGVITFINPTVNEETGEIELIAKGYLVKCVLDRRCFPNPKTYTGTTTTVTRKMVEDNCVSPTDVKRQMPIILSTNPQYNPASDQSEVSVQITGDVLQTKIESLLEAEEMGYDIVPILTQTTISGLEYRVIKGSDRTVGNTEENDAVVFSTDLKNVLNSSYVVNKNDYRNFAYVAGEGEGSERVLIEMGDTVSTGLDRYELYVDARDIQSEEIDEIGETVTLTPEEYLERLLTRGNEKLSEHLKAESYSAGISQSSQFVYGQDYFLGDLVTIQDPSLEMEINARVTEIQATSIGERTMIDVTFGYYKLSTATKLKRNGVI